MENNNKKIRLISISLENVKNIKNSTINFLPNSMSTRYGVGNVYGVYGPNGSGKTALIDSLKILSYLAKGIQLDSKIRNLINIDSGKMRIEYKFSISENGIEDYIFVYSCSIARNISDVNGNSYVSSSNSPSISSETIKYKKLNQIGGYLKTMIEYDVEQAKYDIGMGRIIKPYSLFNFSNPDFFSVYRNIFETTNYGLSFLFSNRLEDIISNRLEEEEQSLLKSFKQFAQTFLYTIDQCDSDNIFFPIIFRKSTSNGRIMAGSGKTNIDRESSLPEPIFYNYESCLKSTNILLKKLIPGMEIEINNKRVFIDGRGGKMIGFQIISNRNGKKIPFSMESNGIRSLVSILCLLINAYSDENILLAIDELDSGVYEYLLGEIIEVFYNGGLGMLIFTSHNLRPLEVLPRENIVFTGMKENSYSRYPYIPGRLNFRNSYLRSIYLDSFDNGKSQIPQSYELNDAFVMASESLKNDNK